MRITITKNTNVESPSKYNQNLWQYIWEDELEHGKQGILHNTDEQWESNSEYYLIYQTRDGTLIKAIFAVKDVNAEMDSYDFADWENPIRLVILTGEDAE